jgi:dihydropyrimidinase
MYDIVIKDAVIKDGYTDFCGDIALEKGKIAALGSGLAGKREIRAQGKWVLPGIIDAHTHMSLPFAGAVSADDFYSGTVAGAFGGVTTIIDFTSQKKGEGLQEGYQRRMAEAEGNAVIDYSFHACIGAFTDKVSQDLGWAVETGLTSLKVFTAYKKAELMLDDAALYRMFQNVRTWGILPTVHAESGVIIDDLIERLARDGKTGMESHIASHPVFTETEAIQRVSHLARSARSPVYIVHVSCGDSIDYIRAEKIMGGEVYVETCPQYCLLNDDLLRSRPGHLFSCTPPLRPEGQQDGLLEGLEDGTISVLATDHCPFTVSAKESWGGDVRALPMGLPGIETLLPLSLQRMKEFGGSVQRVIRALTVQPARLFGLYPRKGCLMPGSDADLVVFDPEMKVTITREGLHMAVDYSPFEGRHVVGWPEITIARGEVIVENGTFIGERGRGRFLKRGIMEKPQS